MILEESALKTIVERSRPRLRSITLGARKQGFTPILNLLGQSISPGAEAGAPGKPGVPRTRGFLSSIGTSFTVCIATSFTVLEFWIASRAGVEARFWLAGVVKPWENWEGAT